MQVYSGKIAKGWPLIMRNIFTLLRRFNPIGARMNPLSTRASKNDLSVFPAMTRSWSSHD